MKICVFVLLLVVPLGAQAPDDDLKTQLAALQKTVADLTTQNAELKKELASLAQRPALSEADQLKRLRAGYTQACQRQGLTFKELAIEASTGKATIVCGR